MREKQRLPGRLPAPTISAPGGKSNRSLGKGQTSAGVCTMSDRRARNGRVLAFISARLRLARQQRVHLAALRTVNCAAIAAARPGGSSFDSRSTAQSSSRVSTAVSTSARPSTTTVISPRWKLGSSARELDELTERPAIHRLVRFRHLTRHGSPSIRAEFRREIGKHLRDAMRRFEEHERSRLAAQAARAATRRSPSRAGRKPSKQNRLVGNPATASAAVIAEGPGIAHDIVARARRLTHQLKSRVRQQRRARVAHQRDVSPASSRASSSGTRCVSLWACSDTSGRDTPIDCSRTSV